MRRRALHAKRKHEGAPRPQGSHPLCRKHQLSADSSVVGHRRSRTSETGRNHAPGRFARGRQKPLRPLRVAAGLSPEVPGVGQRIGSGLEIDSGDLQILPVRARSADVRGDHLQRVLPQYARAGSARYPVAFHTGELRFWQGIDHGRQAWNDGCRLPDAASQPRLGSHRQCRPASASKDPLWLSDRGARCAGHECRTSARPAHSEFALAGALPHQRNHSWTCGGQRH